MQVITRFPRRPIAVLLAIAGVVVVAALIVKTGVNAYS